MRQSKLTKILCCFVLAISISSTPVWASISGTSLGTLVENDGHYTYKYDDPSLLTPKLTTKVKRSASDLPGKYSLVDLGRTTSVKDQGDYGTCWTFGALESLQSNVITQGNADTSIDLSENHLTWFTFNGANSDSDESKYAGLDSFYSSNPYMAGGSRLWSVPTLTRWYGADDESDAPYTSINLALGISSTKQTNSSIHVQDVNYLPETTDEKYEHVSTSIPYIKEALMTNGAISVGFYCNFGNTNYTKISNNSISYYCDHSQSNDTEEFSDEYPNHEVTLVGWDDTYEKENFAITPPSDGAWILKNSWGSNTLGNGYFYLSYYDKTFSEPTSYISENVKYSTNNSSHCYDNIYQYDGIGEGFGITSSSNLSKVANKFTTRNNEVLQAIGTYTIAADSTITFSVYKNSSVSNPESGSILLDSQKIKITNAGFHTIPLDTPITLPKNTSYSIVLSCQYDTNMFAILTEKNYNWQTSMEVTPRVSSLYENGTWREITDNLYGVDSENDQYQVGNANIKAYTTNVSEPEPSTTSTTATTETTTTQPTTQTIPILKKGSIKKLVVGKKKLTIKIKATSKSITGYQIAYKKKGKKYKYTTTRKTTKTIKKLTSKKKYYVKVRCYKTVNGKKYYGSWSTTKIKRVQ